MTNALWVGKKIKGHLTFDIYCFNSFQMLNSFDLFNSGAYTCHSARFTSMVSHKWYEQPQRSVRLCTVKKLGTLHFKPLYILKLQNLTLITGIFSNQILYLLMANDAPQIVQTRGTLSIIIEQCFSLSTQLTTTKLTNMLYFYKNCSSLNIITFGYVYI